MLKNMSDERVAYLTSSVFEISPSVNNKVCLDRPSIGGWLFKCFKGYSSSVPSKSAAIERVKFSAVFAVCSL